MPAGETQGKQFLSQFQLAQQRSELPILGTKFLAKSEGILSTVYQ